MTHGTGLKSINTSRLQLPDTKLLQTTGAETQIQQRNQLLVSTQKIAIKPENGQIPLPGKTIKTIKMIKVNSVSGTYSQLKLLHQSINLFQIRCLNPPPNLNHRSGRELDLNTCSLSINHFRTQQLIVLQAYILFHNQRLNTLPYLNLRTGGELDLNICLLSIKFFRIRHPDTLPYFFQIRRLNPPSNVNHRSSKV